MIDVVEATKSFGSTLAVDKISFQIGKGEVVGFLGPNGAGKSTTMRLITGFLAPDRGRIRVGKYDVLKYPLEAKRLIGYLPENNPLYGEMKVTEYLRFIADLRAVKNKSGAVEEMLDVCGLSSVNSKLIADLSKGYRQRVGLAAAMIADPEILIFDEPTAGLDPNQIVEIRALIAKLGKSKTVFISTHILSEVKAVCSRVIIINKGRIVADGLLDKITLKGKKSLEKVFADLTLE